MAVAAGIKRDIVVVGASLGGVRALRQVFSGLPRDFKGSVAAVLHRGAFHAGGSLVAVIGRDAQLPIIEPEEPVAVTPGTLYLAPRDRHLVFRDHRLEPDRGAQEHFTRPAIDPLFRSAAEIYGSRVVGLILTGRGRDGVSGLVAIKSRGGVSLVQDPDEAEAPVMPESAIMQDNVDLVLPLDRVSTVLVRLAAGEAVHEDALAW
jgi:two-component system, chemotaxis family, protein-glutamate methylesterase/glutaminase